MKTHTLFRWFRRMAMFSGIPALSMMCDCAKLYGPPVDVLYGPPTDYQIFGKVLDKESNQPISGVLVQDEDGDSLTSTDDNGSYELLNVQHCKDLTFIKEGYQTKDTTLCPTMDGSIYMKKITEK